MALREASSMEECIYFTNREMPDGTKIRAWVFRKECPKCGKPMGKPINPKTGRAKKKSDIYVCECGHEENVAEVDKTLDVNIDYKCPECGHEGQTTTKYQRKTWQGVKAYVFECGGCGKKLGVTKKMKLPKEKKK